MLQKCNGHKSQVIAFQNKTQIAIKRNWILHHLKFGCQKDKLDLCEEISYLAESVL